jgi:hypothetical protein
MLRKFVFVVALLPLSLATIACGDAGNAGAAPAAGAFSLTYGCVLTQCDETQERDSAACSRCSSACLQLRRCDVASSCKASCSFTECTEKDRTVCKKEGFKARLGPRSEAVAEACRKFQAAQKDCGTADWHRIECESYAHTEHEGVAAIYSCLAGLSCDPTEDEVAACGASASTGLGDEICAALRAANQECGQAWAENLNRRDPWLRADVRDALRACMRETDGRRMFDCVAAWDRAVR